MYKRQAIDCPGLGSGALLTYAERQPVAGFVPQAAWQVVELSAFGEALPPTAPLPTRFEATGRLARPYQPAGLIFQRPGETSGWAFVIDGPQRRGVWWTWREGALGEPLRGIPLDRPLTVQAQAFARQLLRGWWGAVGLVVVGLGLRVIGNRVGRWRKGGIGEQIQKDQSGD